MEKIRVGTLCSGYDSQCLALERLKRDYPQFDYELMWWSEIDKHAIKAHDALFPQWKDRNLGDMTQIDWTKCEKVDLLFYSTPCQSISQAGLQYGFVEGSGTRSSIIWNVKDALTIIRPKFAVLENVSAMVSAKFIDMFNLWQLTIEGLGYKNYSKILNAKDYGVPQNRDRIFLISIREDVDLHFYFPNPFPLTKLMKDVLEEDVDEKYFISDARLEGLNNSTKKEKDAGNGFAFKLKTRESKIANTIQTNPTGRKTDNFIIKKKLELLNGTVDGCASALTTGKDCASHITDPKGGHKQMGVKETIFLKQHDEIGDGDE